MDTTRAMRLTDSSAPAREQNREIIEFVAPSRAKSVAGIRSRVRAFANSMGFTRDDLDDIGIAVGEASTNAIKHAPNPAHAYINVKMEKQLDTLRVFITDTGPGFDPSAVCPPCDGDLCECGRGIMCMRALMDEVVFHPLAPGTMVELAKRVKPTHRTQPG